MERKDIQVLSIKDYFRGSWKTRVMQDPNTREFVQELLEIYGEEGEAWEDMPEDYDYEVWTEDTVWEVYNIASARLTDGMTTWTELGAIHTDTDEWESFENDLHIPIDRHTPEH